MIGRHGAGSPRRQPPLADRLRARAFVLALDSGVSSHRAVDGLLSMAGSDSKALLLALERVELRCLDRPNRAAERAAHLLRLAASSMGARRDVEGAPGPSTTP